MCKECSQQRWADLSNSGSEGAASSRLCARAEGRAHPIWHLPLWQSTPRHIPLVVQLALAFVVAGIVPTLAAASLGLIDVSDVLDGPLQPISRVQTGALLVLSVGVAGLLGLIVARWLTAPIVELTHAIQALDDATPATRQNGMAHVSLALIASTIPEVASLATALASHQDRVATSMHERLTVETALRKLSHGLSAASGQPAFTSLVHALAEAADAEIAFIGRIIDDAQDRVETLAVVIDGAIVDNFTYDLAGTPCATIVGQHPCVYDAGAQTRFPRDQMLVDLGVEGYAGTPLASSTGQPLGVLAIMSRRAIQNTSIAESVLRIFATRAAAELERFQANAALRESEARYIVTARGSNDGLWDWDLRTDTLHCSERWCSIVGIEHPDEPESSAVWFERVHPDDILEVRTALDAHLLGEAEHFECEARMRDGAGDYRWTHCRGLALRNEQGEPLRIAGSLADVTDRRLAEERLLHDAMHDALTGLPNRTLFVEQLRQMIKRRQRYGPRHFAVLYLDLDRFKVINDSLGHGVGDELLIAVAHRLVACLRETDTIARLGGDEYGILLEDLVHEDEALQIAERLQQSLRTPCELSSHSVVVTASIGVVLGPDHYELPSDLLRDADIAMYRAKELGHARYVVFETSLHDRALALLELESDLRRALDRNQMVLHYQPIVDTADNAITGVEALVRWQHPLADWSPQTSSSATPRSPGLIVPLGDWVLRTAIEQMRAWEEHGLAPKRICVNISARQLHQTDLVERIATLLEENGLEASRLEIELTEGVVVQYAESTVLALRCLRELGVRIAIDDFGTGYSSLAYLTRFPISTVKIDRAFIVDIGCNRVNQAIVTAVTTLAHTIGMHVVAEGVETTDQRDLVRRLGCDEAQGYLVSPACPADEATVWLAEQRASPAGTAGSRPRAQPRSRAASALRPARPRAAVARRHRQVSSARVHLASAGTVQHRRGLLTRRVT